MKTSNQDKRKEIADNFDVNNRKGVITFIILVIMLAILLTCGWYLGGTFIFSVKLIIVILLIAILLGIN